MAISVLIYSYVDPNADMNKILYPELKPLITNICNFYHEKTGQWLQATDFPEFKEKYGVEFNGKYNNTIPFLNYSAR